MKYAILNNGRLDFLEEAESPDAAYKQLASILGISIAELMDAAPRIYPLTERQFLSVNLWNEAGCPARRIPACLCDEKKGWRTPLEKAIDARNWHRKYPGVGRLRPDYVAILKAAGEPIE